MEKWLVVLLAGLPLWGPWRGQLGGWSWTRSESAGGTRLPLGAGVHYKTSPVVGYVRSATVNDPQLDELEALVRTYANEYGYNLVAVYREEGKSRVSRYKPILENVLHAIEANEYVGLITPNDKQLGTLPVTRLLLRRIANTGAWVSFIHTTADH